MEHDPPFEPLPRILARLKKLDRAFPSDEAALWEALQHRLAEEYEVWSLNRQASGLYSALCSPYGCNYGGHVMDGPTPAHALAAAWASRLRHTPGNHVPERERRAQQGDALPEQAALFTA